MQHAFEAGRGGDRYPLHHRSEVDVDADPQSLFAHLDDHRGLAGRMEKPTLVMAGATMRVETDALQDRPSDRSSASPDAFSA